MSYKSTSEVLFITTLPIKRIWASRKKKMLNLYTIINTLLVLVISLGLMSTTSEALPRSIAIERRDVEFDNILGELKSKGSRMRFGKRSADHLEHPDLYMPDRYIWLQ